MSAQVVTYDHDRDSATGIRYREKRAPQLRIAPVTIGSPSFGRGRGGQDVEEDVVWWGGIEGEKEAHAKAPRSKPPTTAGPRLEICQRRGRCPADREQESCL